MNCSLNIFLLEGVDGRVTINKGIFFSTLPNWRMPLMPYSLEVKKLEISEDGVSDVRSRMTILSVRSSKKEKV